MKKSKYSSGTKALRRQAFMLVCNALLVLSVIWSGDAKAEDSGLYWSQLKRAASVCYDRWQMSVTLGGGVEQRGAERETGRGGQSGFFGELKLTVPLYSTTERIGLQERKAQYLEHGAQTLKTYLQAQARLKILQEKMDVVKQTLIQDGVKGIEVYFQVKTEAANAQLEQEAAKRALEAFIGQCD